MGAVWFYHVTRGGIEAVLPPLLERALGAGMRVELRGSDRRRMEALDRALWAEPVDSFLPHGLAGGPHDPRQPVLLTAGEAEAANAPSCVMAIDGAAVAADEAAALARACIIFDGRDPAALAGARGQWRSLTAAGLEAAYWAQEESGWVRKAGG